MPNNGTATRLISGATSDARPKNSSSIGSSPSATAHCACPQRRTTTGAESRRPSAYNSIATAPKDSQNPYASTLAGSNSKTATRASISALAGRSVRPAISATITTTSITKARWVEIAKPANAA